MTDFGSASDAVAEHHLKCRPHLSRDLKDVDTTRPDNEEWKGFAKKRRRVYGDGIRLKLARDAPGEVAFASRSDSLQERLIDRAIAEPHTPTPRRSAKRLGSTGCVVAVRGTSRRAGRLQPGRAGDPPGGLDA